MGEVHHGRAVAAGAYSNAAERVDRIVIATRLVDPGGDRGAVDDAVIPAVAVKVASVQPQGHAVGDGHGGGIPDVVRGGIQPRPDALAVVADQGESVAGEARVRARRIEEFSAAAAATLGVDDLVEVFTHFEVYRIAEHIAAACGLVSHGAAAQVRLVSAQFVEVALKYAVLVEVDTHARVVVGSGTEGVGPGDVHHQDTGAEHRVVVIVAAGVTRERVARREVARRVLPFRIRDIGQQHDGRGHRRHGIPSVLGSKHILVDAAIPICLE